MRRNRAAASGLAWLSALFAMAAIMLALGTNFDGGGGGVFVGGGAWLAFSSRNALRMRSQRLFEKVARDSARSTEPPPAKAARSVKSFHQFGTAPVAGPMQELRFNFIQQRDGRQRRRINRFG